MQPLRVKSNCEICGLAMEEEEKKEIRLEFYSGGKFFDFEWKIFIKKSKLNI